eukprot:scaffold1827_cov421-Prasinococcus_capsulatus_cf.AAC.43
MPPASPDTLHTAVKEKEIARDGAILVSHNPCLFPRHIAEPQNVSLGHTALVIRHERIRLTIAQLHWKLLGERWVLASVKEHA